MSYEESKQDETPIAVKRKSTKVHDASGPIELNSLLPQGKFTEIAYITQVNQKKQVLSEFNENLKRSLEEGRSILLNKENDTIYNVIHHMIEDSNKLVFEQGIRCVELLSRLQDKGILGKKAKDYLNLFFDKAKDTKSQVVKIIKNALYTLLITETISIEQLFEQGLQLASTTKNQRIRLFILDFLAELIDPAYILEE
jgi:hypothetical protein